MRKEPQKITHSFYEAAPEMLLDKIAEIKGILAKQKAKTGETESYLFWARVGDVMKFAWDYCHDPRWILRKNQTLEVENKFLRDWCIQLTSRLEVYEVIREIKLTGQFELAVKKVDDYLTINDQKLNHCEENKPNE